MKDSLLSARVVIRTSNMKISSRRLADYGKKIASENLPDVQHDFFFAIPPILFLICNVVVSSFRRGFIKSLLFQRGQAKIVKKKQQ